MSLTIMQYAHTLLGFSQLVCARAPEEHNCNPFENNCALN